MNAAAVRLTVSARDQTAAGNRPILLAKFFPALIAYGSRRALFSDQVQRSPFPDNNDMLRCRINLIAVHLQRGYRLRREIQASVLHIPVTLEYDLGSVLSRIPGVAYRRILLPVLGNRINGFRSPSRKHIDQCRCYHNECKHKTHHSLNKVPLLHSPLSSVTFPFHNVSVLFS